MIRGEFLTYLEDAWKRHGKSWGERNYPNLTPWFLMDTPPVRYGIYMVDQSWPDEKYPQEVFSFWDGHHWYPQGSSPDKAMRYVCCGMANGRPFKQWRGLRGEEEKERGQ
jgi:hypothetical protein